MQKPPMEGLVIREGMQVSVRKTKAGHDAIISLGEGKIRSVTNEKISIYIPFLEDRIGDADKIKLFWEDGKYYFSGTSSLFYSHYKQYDLLTLEGLDNINYIEKRRHIRLSHTFPIDYKLISQSENISSDNKRRIRSGLVENLSCGGLEYITNDRLGIEDIVELGFEIPSFTSYMVFTQAKIVRISQSHDSEMPYKVAVQFTNIDPHDRKLIAAFILEEVSNQKRSHDDDPKNTIC